MKPSVILKAVLAEGEDFQAAVKELQAKAEGLVEDHKQNMIQSLRNLFEANRMNAEIDGLEDQIKRAQDRLTALREKSTALRQLQLALEAPNKV